MELGFWLKAEGVTAGILRTSALAPAHESAHVGAAKTAMGEQVFAAFAAPTLLRHLCAGRHQSQHHVAKLRVELRIAVRAQMIAIEK